MPLRHVRLVRDLFTVVCNGFCHATACVMCVSLSLYYDVKFDGSHSLCSAGLLSSSVTVIFSHTTPATSSSSRQPNSIFLSQHSSSSLQLQPAERSDYVMHF